jgi:hypothetical protein
MDASILAEVYPRLLAFPRPKSKALLGTSLGARATGIASRVSATPAGSGTARTRRLGASLPDNGRPGHVSILL